MAKKPGTTTSEEYIDMVAGQTGMGGASYQVPVEPVANPAQAVAGVNLAAGQMRVGGASYQVPVEPVVEGEVTQVLGGLHRVPMEPIGEGEMRVSGAFGSNVSTQYDTPQVSFVERTGGTPAEKAATAAEKPMRVPGGVR